MRSTRNLNKTRNPSIQERTLSFEEDVCSLHSWSEDISPYSRSSHSLLVDSDGFVDLKYCVENIGAHSDGYGRFDSHIGKADRVSKNKDESLSHNIHRQHCTATMDIPEQNKPNDRRHKSRKSESETFHAGSQNELPLSLNLKSASFDYPTLWENPLPQDSDSEDMHPVINNHVNDHNKPPSNLKSKNLSSPSSPYRNNVQRLYPYLNDNPEERINSKVLKQKDSPSRPNYFNKAVSPNKQRARQLQEGTLPSSSRSNLGVSSYSKNGVPNLKVRNDGVIGSDINRTSSPASYFKSQPSLFSQQRGKTLKPYNSSDDLESLNEQRWEHRLEPENMKSKMICVWNNLKYGWTFKSKSSIKLDSAVWLLGISYHKRNEDDDDESKFLSDFTTRIWLTYRSNFYPIPGTKLNTDCGWGCMLRSGQMLIAQCLITHFLGREWRIHNQQSETQLSYYKEILRWFSDPIEAPSDKMPFCLHHLVNFGRRYNKVPGEWYGPASVAYIFRDALSRASMSIPILKNICIYVAQDCTVYIEDVHTLCRSRSLSGSGLESRIGVDAHHSTQQPETEDAPWCRSLILLVPVRLGGVTMNKIYSPCLTSLLSSSNCMGIIGGKPKHSLYFLGWQDEKLVYMDPHYCQETVDTSTKNFQTATYHCMSPRKIPINKMDPSCTIGFYIRDAKEFETFVHDVTEFVSPPRQRGVYPLFIFSNGSQEEAELANGQIGTEQGRVKVKHYIVDENGQRRRSVTRESEEFILF